MDQGGGRMEFNRKIFFSFLIAGFVFILWVRTPKTQGVDQLLIAEEGTLEIFARREDRTGIPREGLVLVDEYCHAHDRSDPSVTSVYRLVDGQAWRVRLLCPDLATRSLEVRVSFMGTECASLENPIQDIPKSRRLYLTVDCPQEPSE